MSDDYFEFEGETYTDKFPSKEDRYIRSLFILHFPSYIFREEELENEIKKFKSFYEERINKEKLGASDGN